MLKTDIRPGVVYAYQRYGMHPSDPVEPLVFISGTSWVGTLRQKAEDGAEFAFKRPPARTHKPQRGTGDLGAIGYPAVIIPADRIEPGTSDFGRTITVREFDGLQETVINGFEFVLVTSMKRVVGEWEQS